MEGLHPLRENELVKKSLSEGITDQLLDNVQNAKIWIEKQQENGKKVAIVHASFDALTSSHIQYIQTIVAKLKAEIGDNVKLLVGCECDLVTFKRKEGKKNIYSEEERMYMLSKIQGVDYSYIEFEGLDEQTNNRRPAGIVQYLQPDVFCSHQEHIMEDEELVRNNCKEKGIPYTVVVNYGDEKKYLGEESMRSKFNRSTTNTIKQIISMYKDNPKYSSFVSSQ